jgi:hypothetical protein|tara:strand:- start:492 stop:1109 length:618 start_codon:yes stop_codon:yes gene_type:complete
MALFKPTGSTSTGSNFYGITEIAIMNFQDKSKDFDWADLYLDIEVKQKGSDYTKQLRITGNLEKDDSGKLTGGNALKRMYGFFDVIDEKAGMNVDGNWEDAENKEIDSISAHLNAGHSSLEMPGQEVEEYAYLAYVYKEKPKTPGAKVYSRVFYRIQKNTVDGRKKLEDDVKWFKGKGFIKEATETDIATPQASVEMSASGVGNL